MAEDDKKDEQAKRLSRAKEYASQIGNARSVAEAGSALSKLLYITAHIDNPEVAILISAAQEAYNTKVQEEVAAAAAQVSSILNNPIVQRELLSIFGDYQELYSKQAENEKAMADCLKLSKSYDNFMSAQDPKVALVSLNEVLQAYEPGTLTNHASTYAQQQDLLDKELELIKREKALRLKLGNGRLTEQQEVEFQQRMDKVSVRKDGNKDKFVEHTRKILIAGAAKHAVVGDGEVRAEHIEQIQEKARIFEKSKEVTLLAERKVDEIKNDQKSHVQFEASIKDSCLRDMLAQLETVRNAPGKDATPKATAETQATEPAMSQKKEKKTPDATQKPHPELQNFKAALAQNAKKDNPAVTTTSGRLSFAARVAAQKAAQTGSSIAK